jgi:PPM family protein phosphatase
MTDPEPSIIAPTLRWSGKTHRGNYRPNNEDAFLAISFDGRETHYLGRYGEAVLKGCDYVFAVSDGMGGAKSGEFASRIAVEKITRLLPRSFRSGAQHMEAGIEDLVVELFHAIHEEMTRQARGYEECEDMGATLTLGWFMPGCCWIGHVGDSRAYHLPKDGALAQVSKDDTYVGWLRRKGDINEREARTHPRKNVLQKALGGGHFYVDPQVVMLPLHPGDRFLFCTDGLIDGLWDRRIGELMAEPPLGQLPQDHADHMIKEALEGQGRDNLTALAVEVSAP